MSDYCPVCGRGEQESNSFCPNCGAQLKTDEMRQWEREGECIRQLRGTGPNIDSVMHQWNKPTDTPRTKAAKRKGQVLILIAGVSAPLIGCAIKHFWGKGWAWGLGSLVFLIPLAIVMMGLFTKGSELDNGQID